VVAIIGEFCGTTIFLLFAYLGTQAAQFDGKRLGTSNYIGQPSNTSQLLYIALSFGFSLAVTAWAFFRISGSFFNPAVCLVRP
jgi:aquaporin related protein